MRQAVHLFLRDCRLMFSRAGETAAGVFFFILTVSMFPFTMGGSPAVLHAAAPGIIWIAALLSALLSLESVYHRDHDDGTIDLLLLSGVPPMPLALAKMSAHWVMSGLLLLGAALPAALMLQLPADILPALLGALLVGTLYASLLGGAGAFLTMGARRPGMLTVVLILPLYVPMLILGGLAADAAIAGETVRPYLLLQGALLLAALPLCLMASSAALRMQVTS